MKRRLLTAFHTCFDNALDLRVRIFNVLAIAGLWVRSPSESQPDFRRGGRSRPCGCRRRCASAGLLYYSYRTQKYQHCYLITIVGIFLVCFLTCFSAWAATTAASLPFCVCGRIHRVHAGGKLVLLVTALELALYTSLYIYAYRNPASVTLFPTESGFLTSKLMDFLVVSIALARPCTRRSGCTGRSSEGSTSRTPFWRRPTAPRHNF